MRVTNTTCKENVFSFIHVKYKIKKEFWDFNVTEFGNFVINSNTLNENDLWIKKAHYLYMIINI